MSGASSNRRKFWRTSCIAGGAVLGVCGVFAVRFPASIAKSEPGRLSIDQITMATPLLVPEVEGTILPVAGDDSVEAKLREMYERDGRQMPQYMTGAPANSVVPAQQPAPAASGNQVQPVKNTKKSFWPTLPHRQSQAQPSQQPTQKPQPQAQPPAEEQESGDGGRGSSRLSFLRGKPKTGNDAELSRSATVSSFFRNMIPGANRAADPARRPPGGYSGNSAPPPDFESDANQPPARLDASPGIGNALPAPSGNRVPMEMPPRVEPVDTGLPLQNLPVPLANKPTPLGAPQSFNELPAPSTKEPTPSFNTAAPIVPSLDPDVSLPPLQGSPTGLNAQPTPLQFNEPRDFSSKSIPVPEIPPLIVPAEPAASPTRPKMNPLIMGAAPSEASDSSLLPTLKPAPSTKPLPTPVLDLDEPASSAQPPMALPLPQVPTVPPQADSPKELAPGELSSTPTPLTFSSSPIPLDAKPSAPSLPAAPGTTGTKDLFDPSEDPFASNASPSPMPGSTSSAAPKKTPPAQLPIDPGPAVEVSPMEKKDPFPDLSDDNAVPSPSPEASPFTGKGLDESDLSPPALPGVKSSSTGGAVETLPKVEGLPPRTVTDLSAIPVTIPPNGIAGASMTQKLHQIRSRKEANGLKGYCPVTLRETRELVDAQPQFSAVYKGQQFQFASAKAREKFAADPARYAPVAFGADVVILTNNRDVVEGSLDHAAWYRGRLYLFSSMETHDAFIAEPTKFAVAE